MRLRAVSFDAAGTLFHTVRPVGELYAAVAARHGVCADAADLGRRFRDAFRDSPPLAFPGVPPGELRAREKSWWSVLVARVFAGIAFRDFNAYFEDLFAFFASAAAWRLDPDAVMVLRDLRRDRLAILVVSNFDARVRGVMDALGLAPLVDQLTFSSEAGAAKPDPEIFRIALAAAGLEPEHVLHVGDSVREDLEGARAAGIEALLVGGPELAAEATGAAVVRRLGDVTRWIATAS